MMQNNLRKNLYNLLKTVKRYCMFIHWLVQDSIFRFKKDSIIIVLSGIFGVALQALAFASILFYARAFSSGEPIQILEKDFYARTIEFLIIGSMGVSLLLSLSSLLIYYSRVIILQLSRSYSEYCSRRALNLLSTRILLAEKKSEVNVATIARTVDSDSLLCGRVLRVILYMMIPFMTMCVTFGVLIYIDPLMTFYISLMAPFFLFPQFKTSRAGATYSLLNEKLKPKVAVEYENIIRLFMSQGSSFCRQESNAIQNIFSSGAIKEYLDAFNNRLLILENSKLISNFFKAFILGFILLVMGGGISNNETGWGSLLIYLLALNYTMTYLQSSFSSITVVNIYYPQIHRYFTFLQSFYNQSDHPVSIVPNILININEKYIIGSINKIHIKQGISVGLISSLELNRYNVGSITRTLLGDDEQVLDNILSSVRFAIPNQTFPDISFNEALGLEENTAKSELKIWFPDDNLWRSARKQLPDDLREPIRLDEWDKISVKIKYILSLISIVNSKSSFIMLSHDGLKLLEESIWKFYQKSLKDRVIIITYDNKLQNVGVYGESLIVVMDEDKILGAGNIEWFDDSRNEIIKIIENDIEIIKRKIEDDDIEKFINP